jgi:hypothetical protein
MKFTKHLAVLSLILLPLLSPAQGNAFLKKYAGTYIMLVDGQPERATPDKYVFTADGKCEWTMTFTNDAGKTEVKKTPGTWTAGDGTLQMKFSMGDGEGSELLSDFQWKNGVFHSNETVYLKKVVAHVTPKVTPKPATKK